MLDIRLVTSDTRAPYRILVNTSRPRLSVPNRCAAEGFAKLFRRSCCVSVYGVSTGAKIAAKKNRNTITEQIITIGPLAKNTRNVFLKADFLMFLSISITPSSFLSAD